MIASKRIALFVTLLGLAAQSLAQERKLNIITIVTDDQARWAVSAYGNKECPTPNMDRLAREGAKFTNAFTMTPVCSPSRVGFLTGMYGTQVGITDWINPVEAGAGVGIPTSAVTWPGVLRKNGYATGLVGKWHLGTQPQFHPTKHGFDHFFGFLDGGQSPMDPMLEREGKTERVKGPISDLFVDDAMAFVERNKGKPFALCLNFREPHLPYTPMPEEDSTPFKDVPLTIPPTRTTKDAEQITTWTRHYYASVHAADRNIGRLLAKLDELKLAENTIVLFTSDHGYMIGQHSLHTKGNASFVGGGIQGPRRPNMFEDSIRVPLLIRWPGVVKAGTEISEDVTNLDTFATVLGMLKVPAPDGVKQNGMDFSPLLRGEPMSKREALYGQYDLHNAGLAYMRMIRTGKWKLVRYHFANGLDELYNLEADSNEKKNLYQDESSRRTRDELQVKLTAWQKSIDDPILQGARPLRTEGLLGDSRAN
jgi:choline-sulfatase